MPRYRIRIDLSDLTFVKLRLIRGSGFKDPVIQNHIKAPSFPEIDSSAAMMEEALPAEILGAYLTIEAYYATRAAL